MSSLFQSDYTTATCSDETSEIQRLIRSNALPTDQELELIKKLVAEEEEGVKDLRCEVSELWEAYTAKQRLLNEKTDCIASYHRVLSFGNSAARRFSKEIVQKILRHVIDDDPYTTPKSLTQICSAWRELALNTTELWNHVEVSAGHEEYFLDDAENIKKIAAFRIEKSKDRPFKLVFYIGPCFQQKLNDLPSHILAINPKGICCLELYLPSTMIHALDDIPPDSFPNLQEMMIQLSDILLTPRLPGWQPYLWRPTTRALETAPKLESFSAELFSATDILSLRLPWHQLTTLELTCNLLESEEGLVCNVFAALKECKSLQVCDLSIGEMVIDTRITYTYEHLEYLDIRFSTYAVMRAFCSRICLPKLEILKIRPNAEGLHTSLLPLVDLQHRSKFKLKELRISCVNFDSHEMLAFCLLVPDLTMLDLSRASIRHGAEFITALKCSPTQSPPCPLLRLDTLLLQVSHNQVFSPVLVIDMIRSRGWSEDFDPNVGVVQLKRVDILVPEISSNDSPLWTELQPYARRGLSVSIRTI